jgi:hypothetical protein
MSAESITESDLDAYLDEALPVERMTAIEAALRSRPELARQLVAINGRRDAGVHSLAAIWRQYRITCPSREGLGSYLLGALDDEAAEYMRFHLETIGCRYCRASIADLESQQAESNVGTETRRRRYFQSSAGYLGK